MRADHAHKLTRQILICLNGSAKLILDNGKQKKGVKNSKKWKKQFMSKKEFGIH